MISNYNNSKQLKYLPNNRFCAIYRMLSVKPSWEVEGEVLFGEKITKEEISFVAENTLNKRRKSQDG